MKKCRITVMKVTEHRDLMERFENPMENACGMQEGQVFIANGWEKPEGFCESGALKIKQDDAVFILFLHHLKT